MKVVQRVRLGLVQLVLQGRIGDGGTTAIKLDSSANCRLLDDARGDSWRDRTSKINRRGPSMSIVWLKVPEAAEHAKVSPDTIYTACERGDLKHVRIGGRRAIRLRAEWVDSWLEQHALPPRTAAVDNNTR